MVVTETLIVLFTAIYGFKRTYRLLLKTEKKALRKYPETRQKAQRFTSFVFRGVYTFLLRYKFFRVEGRR